MKFFLILFIPLLITTPSFAQLPAYSGDEASEFEQRQMEEMEQEQQEEEHVDSFGDDIYN